MPSPRPSRPPKPHERRALALLAGCGSGGCTEHVMRMHGFTADQLAELVRFGFVVTTTERVVRSVADIHLAWMPYSHSVMTALGGAVLAWVGIELGMGWRALGRAVGIGIASHLALDLLTHAHDIVLWPGRISPRLGLGLYDAAPMAAFVVEMVYGVVCWWIYRGGRGLLALVVLGNLANLSLFSAAIPGPEGFLAGRPLMVVTLIALQIIVTLVLTGLLAARKQADG